MKSARILVFFLLGAFALRAEEPFPLRGYYLTFMRMPVMGLPEWKQAIDCFTEDDINVIVLWMGGGFRSKKFPVTWQYNEEHANVKNDFARELIDYAHEHRMRVLLGFTPFGYDGVNRYPIEHPELKARKADGSPVDEFGIHCWGWNLCPAREESQRFMREYISEMIFDFYPNADGLLIESSDYNICRCPDCGAHYYDNEFKFVRWISDEMWKRKPNALIEVYPHYFTGQKVPGLDVTAARQTFDPRWALSFAPHSAHFDAELISKASASFYWSDTPVLGTPRGVSEATRAARAHDVTGFMPSMEAFSYVTQHVEGGEPSLVGKRKAPLGFDALSEGKMPFRTLLYRVQREAVSEFGQNPTMSFDEFERRLGKEFFGAENAEATKDLLELQRIWTFESDWYWPSPLLDPEFFQQRATRLKWPREKLAGYDQNLSRLRQILNRYQNSTNAAELEMARLAKTVVNRWDGKTPSSVLSGK